MNTETVRPHTKWLITYLVYDSSYYEEIIKLENNSHVPENYMSMKEQTNALFNTIAAFPFDDQITILIFHLSCVFTDNKSDITVIQKKPDGFDIKDINTGQIIPGLGKAGQPFPSGTDLNNSKIITDIFDFINVHYNYERLMVITFGHGCVFGINLTSRKLFDKLLKKATEVKKVSSDEHSILFDKYFKKNKTYYEIFSKMKRSTNQSIVTLINEKFNFVSADFGNGNSKVKNSGDNPVFLKKYKSLNSLKLKKAFNKKPGLFKLLFNPPFKAEMITEILDPSILTNSELSSGITASLGNKKVDVLVMYNCLMQNLYAQYEFKDAVDYLVAPISGISFPGYDYEAVYDKIKENPNISNENIANVFITSIGKGTLHQPYLEEIKNSWFISTLQLNGGLLKKIKTLYSDWVTTILTVMKKDEKYSTKLSAIVIDTVRPIYNLSADSISDLKVIDFSVFLSRFLDNVNSTSKLDTNDQKLIAITTTSLYTEINRLAKSMVKFLDPEFYGAIDSEYYSDLDFKDDIKGVGVILSISAKMDYPIVNMVFNIDIQEKETIKEIIPSLIKETETNILISLTKY